MVGADYLAYKPIPEIAKEHGFNLDNLYRHFNAFPALKEKRAGNLLGVCDWLIEKGLDKGIDVSPTLFAEAMKVGAKLRGQFIDRTLDLTALLQGATDEELDFFEKMGRLPEPGELTKH